MSSLAKRIPIAIGIKPNQEVTFTNKTIDCAPGNGNTISNIPNSSLVNNSITINGNTIALGGQGTVSIEGGETDPIFSASEAASITLNDKTNWSTAYSWGDHSAEGYLTSYTETDPIFSASEAASITSTDTSNWNTAYGWGNHASAGYLTSLPSRLNATSTTPLLNPGSSANITFTTAKSYALLKITTSAASWVTIYTDSASRLADVSRVQGVDPSPGSGVIAEAITTGAETVLFTPSTIGWNNDGNNIIYAKVVNNHTSDAQVSVTLTYIPLEG